MPLPIIRFGVKGISSIIEITGNPYDSLAIDRYGAVSGEFPDIDTDSIIDFTSSDQGLYAGLRFSDNKMLTPKPTPSRSVNAGRSLWVRELANLARTSLLPLLAHYTPRYTGKLEASTSYIVGSERISKDEDIVKLVIYQNARREKFFYRHIVARGRHPGPNLPPRHRIEEWVRFKFGYALGDPIALSKKITASMAIRGTQGNPYTGQFVSAAQPHIDQLGQKLGQQLVVSMVDPAPYQEAQSTIAIMREYERDVYGRFAPYKDL